MEKQFSIIKKSDPKNSVVELELEISADALEEKRKEAVQSHAGHIQIPGFRAGHVPPEIAEKNMDEQHILEDAAEDALNGLYPDIIKEADIKPESTPRVSIRTIEKGKPFTCILSIAVRPDVELGNYKKIAKKAKENRKDSPVEEKEIGQMLESLRNSQKKEDGTLPELDDAFAASFGETKTLEELKQQIRETLQKEKEYASRERQLSELGTSLLKESKLTLPEAMVEDELHAAVHDLRHNLEAHKVSVEEYLKNAGKTEEEFLKDMRTSAEERLKMKYIISEIAKQENIEPDEKELEEETKRILSQYRNASPERTKEYVREMLINRKVLDFLEKAEF